MLEIIEKIKNLFTTFDLIFIFDSFGLNVIYYYVKICYSQKMMIFISISKIIIQL